MKKILIFAASALLLSSCLGNNKNSQSYLLQATFDYNLESPGVKETFDKDSLFIGFKNAKVNYFGYADLAFFFTQNEKLDITGGCSLTYSRDYLPYEAIDGNWNPKFWSVYEDKTYKEPEKPEKPEEKPTKADGKTEDNRRLLPPNCALLFHDDPDGKMPEHDIAFIRTDLGTCTLQACAINNTAQVVKAVKENFKENDYIKVIATGILGGKETGKAEFFLARNTPEKREVVTKWTKFDLSALGDVDFIDFEWESSNPAIPPYFCIDLLTAAISLSW